MKLIDAYQKEKLSVALAASPRHEQPVTALIEIPEGIMFTGSNVLDPFAVRVIHIAEGEEKGEGPWVVGNFIFDTIRGDEAMKEAWEEFLKVAPEGYRQEVEEFLKENAP